MKNFLPIGYESLKTEKSYWKMSQMKDGDNRLRIVKQPIAGWIDWKDSKPYRYTPDQKPAKPFDAAKSIKPFWSLYVWDYAREGLFILEINQMSIIKALTKIATDEDWGDFLQYDIKINKAGSGKETRYTLTPLPHKPLADKIADALRKSPVRLEALYHGGDPWSDFTEPQINHSTGEILESGEIITSIEELKKCLQEEGMEVVDLDSYLSDLSAKKKQPVDYIIGSALEPQLFPKFKAAYAKELVRRAELAQLAAV